MSKTPRKFLFATAMTMALLTSAPAWAQRRHYDHGGHHSGWGLGLGLLLGSAIVLGATHPPPVYQAPPVYVSPPSYYPEPAYVTPYVAPYVYSPPAAVAPAPPTQAWWYHCTNPEGYYPYVTSCPTGWTRVSPVPPGG